MKGWFKKYIPTKESVKKYREMKILKPFLKSPSLWSFDCQSVARGVASGLAGAMIPGFQFFYAALLAIVLKGNLPIALIATFITNPITVIPIVYFICFVGSLVIKNEQYPCTIHHFSWDFSSFYDFWSSFNIWASQFGKAFSIGVILVSISFAIIGYFGTILLWKIITFLFYFKKK